jgi:RNA polymerase sigma factor (sigma-70 family)
MNIFPRVDPFLLPARSTAVLGLRPRADRLSDESLLAGMSAGDHDATRTFIGRHERRVYGLALRMLHDPALAEDIAQETFSRAWRRAPAHDPRRGSVATWLLSITRNLAIDTLRLRRPDPIDPADLAQSTLPSWEEGPGESAVRAHERDRVREALSHLPVEQRRALILSVFEGRTAREIGLFEQIPLGTAKTRIRAGLIKMSGLLADEADSR